MHHNILCCRICIYTNVHLYGFVNESCNSYSLCNSYRKDYKRMVFHLLNEKYVWQIFCWLKKQKKFLIATIIDLPVCKRICLVRWASWVNCLPQNWHVYGFSPVCSWICEIRLLNEAHFLPHCQHSGSWPACLCLWTSSSAFVLQFFRHSC